MAKSIIWFPPHRDTNLLPDSGPTHIYSLGLNYRMKPGMVLRERGTADYFLMHSYNPVEIQAGEQITEYPAHTFIIWKPGAVHHYGHTRRAWTHSWIHCSGILPALLFRMPHLTTGQPIVLGSPDLVDRFLGDIYRELGQNPEPSRPIVDGYLSVWIHQLQRLARSGVNGLPPEDRLFKIRRFLETNFSERITLSDLAGMAGLSSGYLCTEFHRAFGETPIIYLRRVRLQRAAYLLRDRSLNISEVAGLVGFEDPLYFSRLYHAHFGLSPRQHRQLESIGVSP